jgi:hypothetical protein
MVVGGVRHGQREVEQSLAPSNGLAVQLPEFGELGAVVIHP